MENQLATGLFRVAVFPGRDSWHLGDFFERKLEVSFEIETKSPLVVDVDDAERAPVGTSKGVDEKRESVHKSLQVRRDRLPFGKRLSERKTKKIKENEKPT